jgi:hypothetical protein
MEVAQVPDKFLVRNNTAGWVGVVKLDHRGEEKGVSVAPYGSVWLSELEMQVTARAPRLPEDNPFAEQTLILTNPETGARQEYQTRPLTLERDAERYTPAEERYVPTLDAPREAVPAQRKEASVPEEITLAPRSAVTSDEPPPPTVVPVPPGPAMRRAQGQPTGTPQPPSGEESWVREPEAPGEVLPGQLDGSDEAPPDPTRWPEPSGPDERFVPSVVGAQAAPQTPGSMEEHAKAVDPDIGEETGQAKPPAQPPPEGEYAQAEEVGSPDAPSGEVNDETVAWE